MADERVSPVGDFPGSQEGGGPPPPRQEEAVRADERVQEGGARLGEEAV